MAFTTIFETPTLGAGDVIAAKKAYDRVGPLPTTGADFGSLYCIADDVLSIAQVGGNYCWRTPVADTLSRYVMINVGPQRRFRIRWKSSLSAYEYVCALVLIDPLTMTNPFGTAFGQMGGPGANFSTQINVSDIYTLEVDFSIDLRGFITWTYKAWGSTQNPDVDAPFRSVSNPVNQRISLRDESGVLLGFVDRDIRIYSVRVETDTPVGHSSGAQEMLNLGTAGYGAIVPCTFPVNTSSVVNGVNQSSFTIRRTSTVRIRFSGLSLQFWGVNGVGEADQSANYTVRHKARVNTGAWGEASGTVSAGGVLNLSEPGITGNVGDVLEEWVYISGTAWPVDNINAQVVTGADVLDTSSPSWVTQSDGSFIWGRAGLISTSDKRKAIGLIGNDVDRAYAYNALEIVGVPCLAIAMGGTSFIHYYSCMGYFRRTWLQAFCGAILLGLGGQNDFSVSPLGSELAVLRELNAMLDSSVFDGKKKLLILPTPTVRTNPSPVATTFNTIGTQPKALSAVGAFGWHAISTLLARWADKVCAGPRNAVTDPSTGQWKLLSGGIRATDNGIHPVSAGYTAMTSALAAEVTDYVNSLSSGVGGNGDMALSTTTTITLSNSAYVEVGTVGSGLYIDSLENATLRFVISPTQPAITVRGIRIDERTGFRLSVDILNQKGWLISEKPTSLVAIGS